MPPPTSTQTSLLSPPLADLADLVVKDRVAVSSLNEAQRLATFALVCTTVPPNRTLREAQVNEALKAALAGPCCFLNVDHVELRRWLVDSCWLSRDRYGRFYRRAEALDLPPQQRDAMTTLAQIDVIAWVDDLRTAESERRQERRQAWHRQQVAIRDQVR